MAANQGCVPGKFVPRTAGFFPATAWLAGLIILGLGVIQGRSQEFQWAQQTGGYAVGTSVVASQSGEIAYAGYFWSSTAGLGATTLTNWGMTNSSDLFLAKCNKDGQIVDVSMAEERRQSGGSHCAGAGLEPRRHEMPAPTPSWLSTPPPSKPAPRPCRPWRPWLRPWMLGCPTIRQLDAAGRAGPNLRGPNLRCFGRAACKLSFPITLMIHSMCGRSRRPRASRSAFTGAARLR